MKNILFALLVASFALPVSLRSVRAGEVDTSTLGHVLGVVLLDINGDGGTDRAVLVEGSEGGVADLYVFISKFNDATKEYEYPLALTKPGVVFDGAMWGTHPTLESNAKGSLAIKSQNDAIGRNRWSQALTVTFRNGELTIVGITYASRDTLDPSADGSCDLNLVTGRGVRNGRAVAPGTGPIRLADWSDEKLPKACQF